MGPYTYNGTLLNFTISNFSPSVQDTPITCGLSTTTSSASFSLPSSLTYALYFTDDSFFGNSFFVYYNGSSIYSDTFNNGDSFTILLSAYGVYFYQNGSLLINQSLVSGTSSLYFYSYLQYPVTISNISYSYTVIGPQGDTGPQGSGATGQQGATGVTGPLNPYVTVNTVSPYATSVGLSVLQLNTGIYNCGFGESSLALNTSGYYNNAFGGSSLGRNVTGFQNNAFGYNSLYNSTGNYNSAFGHSTLGGNSGNLNSVFGFNSGSAITSGSSNVIIGSYTGSGTPINATGSNYIVLSDGSANVRQVIDNNGNAYLGSSSSTTMTNGFFYIPSATGPPTGVPTSISGQVPMYFDATNNKFYIYNGGWKGVILA